MNSFNSQEQDFFKKEQEIRAREVEIRLRELELEINQKTQQHKVDIPHYQTRKHENTPSYWQKIAKKAIKIAKFLGFSIFTIALMRVSFLLGMWIAYAMITVFIIFISYQIFLSNSDN